MSKTTYSIDGLDVLINNKLTYSEIPNSNKKVHGLLFNARFIQGVFDDVANIGLYDRFGKKFDPEKNTDELIEALPQWYDRGLRAFTVGVQGGGPIYSFGLNDLHGNSWSSINTNSFSKDGKVLSESYKKRLERLIKAADEIGMIVIVSILYQAQEHLFESDAAMAEAVRTTCEFLKEIDYSNVMIEIANEHTVGNFSKRKLIYDTGSMSLLIRLAKEWSGHKFAIGASPGGGEWSKAVVDESDIILIHGNGLDREWYSRFIKEIKDYCNNKPIICNEDSQKFGQLEVAVDSHTSWGYYNNFTKQEPPTNWSITKGEDEYFARRMEKLIFNKEIEDEYYLQGFEENLNMGDRRYIRLAASNPEKIDKVFFYEDDKLLSVHYDEPYMLYAVGTWLQDPYIKNENAKKFRAEVYLVSGEKLIIEENLK